MPTDTVRAEALLGPLQRATYQYFLDERTPANGLVRDRSEPDSPCSIAAVGLGLACAAVAAERGFVGRAEAAGHVRDTLRFFWESEQSRSRRATGYRGFYYHFLDMEGGRRAGRCELSTVDSTILFAGALLAARYFDADDGGPEADLRGLADALYRRADWTWALNRTRTSGPAPAVAHGWTPERGFLHARWRGYDEALLLYALALGSPTHPVPPASYTVWTDAFRWKTIYGHEMAYAGPLFIHQLAYCWIDPRGIQDAPMRARGMDYFENSRRATLVQREYATRNPRGFRGYGPDTWGITASGGPGPATAVIDGRRRHFSDYRARGVPWGYDDGTLSPWAVVASLPFAPEIVLPAVDHLHQTYPEMTGRYGLACSFNPTFAGCAPNGHPAGAQAGHGWISDVAYGLDQGPVVLMIENYASGLPWRLMRGCPYLAGGLRQAGFTGGWLDERSPDDTPA